MSDAPRLATTNAVSNYAPYSVTAIVAITVSVLFASILLLLGITSFLSGTPFVHPLLLALPLIAIVLSFAARRQILNSEGTRDGMNLCNLAWWIAMLGGMGYAAYLAANTYAIRKDASGAFDVWTASIVKIDPTSYQTPEFVNALRPVIPTGQQRSVFAKTPAAAEQLLKSWRDEATWLRQLDVIRIATRNQGDNGVTFIAGGLQSWDRDTKNGLSCKIAATMKCAEGDFQLVVPMVQQLVEGEPVWQIQPSSQGFIVGGHLTPYGGLMRDVEVTASAVVYRFFIDLADSPGQYPELFKQFGKGLVKGAQPPNIQVYQSSANRLILTGGAGWVIPEPKDFANEILTKHFEPVDRSSKVIEQDQREKFLAVLRGGRMTQPGSILKDSRDQGTILKLSPNSIEARVPIELQAPRAEASQSASRGVVVLQCDDPEFMKRVNDLRASAANDVLEDGRTVAVGAGFVPWRVLRIESDMKPIAAARPQESGPPGG